MKEFLQVILKGHPLGGAVVKNLPINVGDARDVGLILGLGRSSGGGNGNPLQYSCLANPTDRGIWQASPWGCKELDMTSTHAHTCSVFAAIF